MEFDKIRFDGTKVELDYTEIGAGETEKSTETRGKDPSPAFKNALKAFAPYVRWVMSAPDDWKPEIDVRGVTIKRPDDAPRGITVTAVITCPRARNSGLTVNTPYLAEPPEGYAGDGSSFLKPEVVKLLDALEERATEYLDGERGEQIGLGLGDSENSKAFGERAAASGVASTRTPKANGKGKGKKGKDFVAGVGTVHNPDAVEVLDNAGIRQLLLSVERDVPIDAIALWTSSERGQAVVWAQWRTKEILNALKPDEKFPDRIPAEPPCLLASATPSLLETR